MKRFFLTAFFLSLVFPLFSGGSSQFRLDWKIDAPLLGIGGGVLIAGAISQHFAEPPGSDTEGWTAWPTFEFNKDLADWSNYLLFGGLASIPFLLDRWTAAEEILTLGVMYAETMALSWGIKESLKGVLTKYRPFTQFDSPPEDLMAEADRYLSFPSGHATMTFTTAGFATTVFSASDAPLLAKYVFGIANFSVATGAATLRVVSGKHHLVDVVAGALLGTLSGIIVPHLHRISQEEGISLRVGPSSLMVGLSF